MYTYEYERICAKGFFELKIEGYGEIIACRAEDGWRYVGNIPVLQDSHGLILKMDLVFEKELP